LTITIHKSPSGSQTSLANLLYHASLRKGVTAASGVGLAAGNQAFIRGQTMDIYVGNLGPDVTETEIEELFKPFGQVASVQLMRELFTGKGRGFGFVEMPGRQQSAAAITGLNGKELAGRPLKVNEARERPQRGRRGR
jgi:RNA recognition motif-containing protein